MFVVSIKIRLFTAAKVHDGKHPVVLQVIYKNSSDSPSQVRRKRLGMFAYPDQWAGERYKTSMNHGRKLNQKLDEIEQKAWDVYYNHFYSRTFNYREFLELFVHDNKKYDLKGLMEELFQELTLQGLVGTAMSYQCAVKSAYSFHDGPTLYYPKMTG